MITRRIKRMFFTQFLLCYETLVEKFNGVLH